MGDNTKISWAHATWNCIYGCSKVSAGCQNCYAERHCHRFAGAGQRHEGLTKPTQNGPRWTGKVQLAPHRLDVPLRWKRGRRIFVNSLSDLFHPGVPYRYAAAVFGIMNACPQHTFLVLTKRPERMRECLQFGWVENKVSPDFLLCEDFAIDALEAAGIDTKGGFANPQDVWPPPNVHLGVTVENQDAIHRIDDLLACPAASYFLSLEPLLGPIELDSRHLPCPHKGDEEACSRCWASHQDAEPYCTRKSFIDHVIVGGESGPGARPCDVGNIRSIIEQCREAGVACFNKQLGAHVTWDGITKPGQEWGQTPMVVDTGLGHWRVNLIHSKGGEQHEWPADLRVQEFPT